MDRDHSGHRERLRREFLKNGMEGWSETKVLEFVLFFAVPRRDTAELARNLTDRFGSIGNVFRASAEELQKTDGIGQNAALLISAMNKVGHFVDIARENEVKIDTHEKQIEFLRPYFRGLGREAMYILCLDAQFRNRGVREVAHGGARQVRISIKSLTRAAVAAGADYVVMAHNHIVGGTDPSPDDIAATQDAKIALRQVDIDLFAHYVFCGNRAKAIGGF